MGVRGALTVPRLSQLFGREDEVLMEDDRDGVGRRWGVTMDGMREKNLTAICVPFAANRLMISNELDEPKERRQA